MGTIRILSRKRFYADRELESFSGSYLSESSLPFFYMSDYSVLGLLVDDLPLAVRVLKNGSITLGGIGHNQESATIRSGDFLRTVQLLHEMGVGYDVADVVHGIYQG
jgi:hypothetical protein